MVELVLQAAVGSQGFLGLLGIAHGVLQAAQLGLAGQQVFEHRLALVPQGAQ